MFEEKGLSKTGEMLRRLIRIDSTNPGAYEGEMGDFVEKYLVKSGFSVTVREVRPGRCNVMGRLEPAEAKERVPALVFLCHLDTVQVGDGWTMDPFAGTFDREKNRIYGRGSCDMKAGTAAALIAFKEIAREAKEGLRRLRRPLVFIGTMDEEGDMQGVQAAVADGWIGKDDWLVDTEPTDETAQMAHRGRAWFAVNVRGVTAHASMPEKGADAIAAAAEVISRMRDCVAGLNESRKEKEQPTTITFGQISGGYSPYVVPDRCSFTIDMRLSYPDRMETVRERLYGISQQVERSIPGVTVEIEVTGDWPAIPLREDSPLLVRMLSCAERVLGYRPRIVPFPGYTDTAAAAALTGCKNTLSFGPGNLAQAHKPDEYVDADQPDRCRKIYEELIRTTVF